MKCKLILTALMTTMMALGAMTSYGRSIDKPFIPAPGSCITDTLPSGDTLIAQLSTIDLAHYIGLPVDSLLHQLPSGIIDQDVSSYNRPDLAEVLFVNYNSDVSVMIFVHGFAYMDPHLVNSSTPKQNWQVSLFRKESMAYAIIFNGSACINGCEYQRR